MSFGAIKTTKVRITAMTFSKLMVELNLGASSMTDLQNSTGLARATLYDYIRELRKAKLVYVAGFDRAANNCPMIPLYAWGPGEHDKKIKPISPADKARNYRRNKREREVHLRLTLLGGRERANPAQEGGRGTAPMDY